MARQTYDITRSPRDGKWYVMGYCGRNKTTGEHEWMVCSTAFMIWPCPVAGGAPFPLSEEESQPTATCYAMSRI